MRHGHLDAPIGALLLEGPPHHQRADAAVERWTHSLEEECSTMSAGCSSRWPTMQWLGVHTPSGALWRLGDLGDALILLRRLCRLLNERNVVGEKWLDMLTGFLKGQ